jgi:hypothetical protein
MDLVDKAPLVRGGIDRPRRYQRDCRPNPKYLGYDEEDVAWKKKRSMQRGNVKKQLHVTCNVGKGTWQLSIIWQKWNESFTEES